MKAPSTITGTSFHGQTVFTTPQKLIDLADLIGADYYQGNSGEDKTNFDFDFSTDDDIYFTVYDWKEYRVLDPHEIVEFHIGAASDLDAREALLALELILVRL